MASSSSRPPEKEPIVVSAAGLATSLGRLAPACAAARAGIARRLPLGLVLPNPGEEEPAELKGHVCPEAVGSEDYGRLVALLVPAVREAVGSGPAAPLDPRTRVYLVLPREEERAALFEIDEPEEQFPGGPDAFVLERLRALALPGLDPGRAQVSRGGHSGIIDTIAQATQEMAQRAIDRAIVCAADSLADEMTVQGLAGQRRIRSAAAPDGMFPGEAGAALVLESEQSAQRRGARPLARIGPSAHQAEPPPPERKEDGGEEPPEAPWSLRGSALADAIAAVETADPRAVQSVMGLIDEFNGESARAKYFWTNLARAGVRSEPLRRLLQIPRWSPAEVFGDVGAVTGALHLCVALRAFARGYAPGGSFLVCNTSDSGAAGAMVVRAP